MIRARSSRERKPIELRPGTTLLPQRGGSRREDNFCRSACRLPYGEGLFGFIERIDPVDCRNDLLGFDERVMPAKSAGEPMVVEKVDLAEEGLAQFTSADCRSWRRRRTKCPPGLEGRSGGRNPAACAIDNDVEKTGCFCAGAQSGSAGFGPWPESRGAGCLSADLTSPTLSRRTPGRTAARTARARRRRR